MPLFCICMFNSILYLYVQLCAAVCCCAAVFVCSTLYLGAVVLLVRDSECFVMGAGAVPLVCVMLCSW